MPNEDQRLTDFVLASSASLMNEVDTYGLPLSAFGDEVPSEFFEILGRIIAVNAKIEYIKSRVEHLPKSETDGVRKVEQFLSRYESGRLDRNAIVHSMWAFGAHALDSEVILGVRYKASKAVSGEVATATIRDFEGSERAHPYIEHTLDSLRQLLRRDISTMVIGQQALTLIGMTWAAGQTDQSS